MDVKTLSAMLGHVSAATTLDIYTHVTVGYAERGGGQNRPGDWATRCWRALSRQSRDPAANFQPVLRKTRKPGTGCITPDQ